MVDDDVQNKSDTEISYTPVYEHILLACKTQWKGFILTFITIFGIIWMFIEAISYLSNLNLSNNFVLFGNLLVSLFAAISKMIFSYINSVPSGLQDEPKDTHKIAVFKKPFWEYKLAYILLNYRLKDIDSKLDDLLGGKVHIKIEKNLSIKEYIDWLSVQPSNLLKMVDVAKNLLIFELFSSLKRDKGKELDIPKLVKVSDMIKNLYEDVYQFELEGKQTKIPEGFELVHEIQSEWVTVIRDGVRQILDILLAISDRSPKDLTPIQGTIEFREPPRVDEFNNELNRLERMLPMLMANDY